ncbi:hypothetical protein CsatB_001093 [Cannabis sativa]|uniref:Uncharacterized protein n=1 Tax=Cannabis sativa TaxID=3483 RepID=A0A7J6EAX6_CANSA|nr:hypothetical protein F8388_022330 [Cannabis sativa]KAF4369634.1 hypothetical protein F8388_021967 [Cannabis sativa]
MERNLGGNKKKRNIQLTLEKRLDTIPVSSIVNEGFQGQDDDFGDKVYAYQQNKVESYKFRGIGLNKSPISFDDYGGAISFSFTKD